MRGAILGLLLTSWAAASDPIPGRNRVPEGATLCVVWTVDIDEVDELTLRGKQVDTVHVKGQHPRRSTIELFVPLPRRELGLFARFRRGRGKVEVVQDPSRANGYRAIVRVTDTKSGWAKQVVEIFYGPRPVAVPRRAARRRRNDVFAILGRAGKSNTSARGGDAGGIPLGRDRRGLRRARRRRARPRASARPGCACENHEVLMGES